MLNPPKAFATCRCWPQEQRRDACYALDVAWQSPNDFFVTRWDLAIGKSSREATCFIAAIAFAVTVKLSL